MANRIYEVRLHVAEGNLGTVLSALHGSADLVSVVPTQKAASSTRSSTDSSTPPRDFHYAEGKRNKGISGQELLMKTLSAESRPFTLGEIVNTFTKHGFAKTSATPVLSIMTRAGKIRALGAGRFCLPGTTVHI